MKPATHSGAIAKKGLCCTLAFTLAVSALPLAGCASSQISDTSEAISDLPVYEEPKIDVDALTLSYDTSSFSSPSERFESVDDGCEELDVAETHISANAKTQEINITAEGTTFTSQIAPEDITLTGGMSDWTVASIERSSNTHLAITVERPDSVSPLGNGADIAGVEIAARCVQPVEDDLSGIEDLIAHMDNPGTGDDPDETDATADDPDADASESASVVEGEFAVIDETDPAAAGPLEAMDESWSVSIPFVVPFMAVDVADTQVEDDSTTFHIVASNFVLPEHLSIEDFSIELADAAPENSVAPELVSVSRINDFELQAVVAGNALDQDSALDYAVLNFHGGSNGTGGDVLGSLLVPDAWVHASAKIEDGQVSIDASLINSDEEITDENTDISILQEDGTLQKVTDATITSDEDGTTDITFDLDSPSELDDTPTIVIDPASIDHASGVEVDIDPCYVPVSGSASDEERETGLLTAFAPEQAWAADGSSIFSKIASWASSLDLSEMAFSAAKSSLGSLASAGWSKARTTILQDTFLGDRSNTQIYDLVSALQDQMSTLTTQIQQLSDTVSANYYGTIVNDANQIITDIKSDYTYLSDLYPKVLAEKEDSPEQAAAIKNLMDERGSTVESLIKNLNRLASKIKCADATRNLGLIASYDTMAAKSYNWAGEAAAPRIAYRASLATLWADATSMLYVICGSDAYKDKYGASLAALQETTKTVNDIISSSEVEESEYKRASTEYGTEEGMAYYCYTTGSWYVLYKGTDSPVGWDNVYLKKINKGKVGVYSSENPFSSYVSNNKNAQWKSDYMNDAEASLLAARCRPGSSLQQEIRSFATSVPKYLLVGAKFECDGGKFPKNQNDWTFDTYTEVSPTSASLHETAKALYESETQTTNIIKKTTKHYVYTSTPLEDMFVLARVDVS